MISSFFKTNRSKRFEYRARYYDEVKEDIENRFNAAKAEKENLQYSYNSSNFKHNLRHNWERNKKSGSPRRKSNLRILLIAILLFLIFYYFLY